MRRFMVVGFGLALALGAATLVRAEKKEASVTGELVDNYCYATMGAKGASHKDCAIACAKKGIPVGLLEKGTDKLYVLLPAKDKGALPDAVIAKMSETVTISGSAYTQNGVNFLTVDSVK